MSLTAEERAYVKSKLFQGLKEVIFKIIENPKIIALGGCAVYGWYSVPKNSKIELKLAGSFSGVMGMELATSQSDAASIVGLGILGGLSVIYSTEIINEFIQDWMKTNLDSWTASEGIENPIFKPEDVLEHVGARYCIACPVCTWEECGPYLSALLEQYKLHYYNTHKTPGAR